MEWVIYWLDGWERFLFGSQQYNCTYAVATHHTWRMLLVYVLNFSLSILAMSIAAERYVHLGERLN